MECNWQYSTIFAQTRILFAGTDGGIVDDGIGLPEGCRALLGRDQAKCGEHMAEAQSLLFFCGWEVRYICAA